MSIGTIFISHSAKKPDYQVAKSLAVALEKMGLNVWWDEKRLKAGAYFPAEIVEAIISQRFFLYIMSPRSTASRWCSRELTRATELGRDIVPLLLEEVPIHKQPIEISGLQYIDIRKGVRESLPIILQALGLGMRSELEIQDDPFARDSRLVQTITNQLNYAPTFTDSLNLVLMLKSIGESLCETDRARRLFAEMLSQATSGGWRFDYDRVRDYLLRGW